MVCYSVSSCGNQTIHLCSGLFLSRNCPFYMAKCVFNSITSILIGNTTALLFNSRTLILTL